MLIDCHCHFDRIQDPQAFLFENESRGNYIIGMTNTPRHFLIGFPHVKCCRFIRLALGFHPQAIEEIHSQLSLFKELINKTSYIGEVGLDYSKNFIATKNRQIACFEEICSSLSKKKKIISIHSLRAESDLVSILSNYSINTPVFHWYSGPLRLIPTILNMGGYFSINEAMTLSKHGQEIIRKIPTERMLTETDLPYNPKSNISHTLKYIGIDSNIIYDNFKVLLSTLTYR